MTRLSLLLFFALLASARADTLTLRSGVTVRGAWVGIDADQITFRVDNQLRTYPRSEVVKVTFEP